VSPWAYQVPPLAPKPGIIPLRPLGVGELLDGAFTTIRRYPAATLGLAAGVMLVVETIQVLVQYVLLRGVDTSTSVSANGSFSSTSGSGSGSAAAASIIVVVIGLVAAALLAGMLSTVVSKGVLGRPVSAAEAWAETRPRLLRLIAVTLLVLVISLVAAGLCIVPGIVVLVAVPSTAPGVILLVVGGIAAFAVAVWVWVGLLFATPIVVFEKQGVWAALNRSRTLIRGGWWRTFGIELLAALISGTISSIIVVPFVIAGGIGNTFGNNPTTQLTFTHLLLTGIGGFLAGTLVRPFTGGMVALLYVDRRMRAEGLDLTLAQAATNPS
jgi:hypothetical protein